MAMRADLAGNRIYLASRLLMQIEVVENGCWEWRGPKTRGGYGSFCSEGRMVYAHRESYRLFCGDIPAGECIDHLCRNRGCVNPNHLQAVSYRLNSLRGANPDLTRERSKKATCWNGHAMTPENTYSYQRKGYDCRGCLTCRREATAKYTAKRSAKRKENHREHR